MLLFQNGGIRVTKASNIFKAAGALEKFGSSLKPNHHSQVELVQIPVMYCRNRVSGSLLFHYDKPS